MRRILAVLAVLSAVVIALPYVTAQEKQKSEGTTIWQGEMHLGDNPEAFDKTPSAGMCMQVPFKTDAAKKFTITVTATDVETLAGDGHYVEIVAHYQPEGKAKAGGVTKEEIAGTFRIKDDSGIKRNYSFEIDPKKALKSAPTYFSVRIKVDTSVRYGLWDDFVITRVVVKTVS